MTFSLLLQLSGASLVLLAAFHAVLWRSLNWDREIERLSPLNARVFAVHAFFIAFVLGALGLLSLFRPDLLLAPSELARLILSSVALFWAVRLLMQPLIFDRAMRSGWTRSLWLRIGVCLLWAGYAAIYGTALLRQLGRAP